MTLTLQPIYLLADSQLLFWKKGDVTFLNSIRSLIEHSAPKAAYIGASNGDDPRYYSIFEAAMAGIDIQNCRMILSSFPADQESFINEADIILLAGGDVQRGWRVFQSVGLREVLIRRYYEGAILIGVSAGAVQLGLYSFVEREGAFNVLIDTLKLVPFIISAHDEASDWYDLRRVIQLLNSGARGIGIPAGGGLIYYPDSSIEALRHAVDEFVLEGDKIKRSYLIPQEKWRTRRLYD